MVGAYGSVAVQGAHAELRQEGVGSEHTSWGLKIAQNAEIENPHSSPCFNLLLLQTVLRLIQSPCLWMLSSFQQWLLGALPPNPH